MQLTAIHHIAIIVSDYNRSKDFYVNKLGFSVIRENYRPERNDWKSRTGNLRCVQSTCQSITSGSGEDVRKDSRK